MRILPNLHSHKYTAMRYVSQLRVSHAVFIYFVIRFSSFLTFPHPILNQGIAAVLILAFGYLCIRNISLGWIVLMSELLLDGSGHFFELHGFILRTWFLGIFFALWMLKKVKTGQIPQIHARQILFTMLLFLGVIFFSGINGLIEHHRPLNVLQDAILYFFLLLLFPSVDIKSGIRQLFPLLIKGYIVGTAIFSLISFFVYSSGIGTLPDRYYHWFRNVAAGKITDLGDHFFRIVLPEHLFIVPIILVLVSYLIQNPKDKKIWMYQVCSLSILVLNFSRIYILALVVGLGVLFYRTTINKWLKVSVLTLACFFAIFSSVSLVASRGQSVGLGLLAGRAEGTVAPDSELSGATRMALLPDILETIKKHPWIGSGLGATVTYSDPLTEERLTRTQFDWGYLEMVAELGSIGVSVFFTFLFLLLYAVVRLGYDFHTNHQLEIPLFQGLLAGAVALLIINITTPALFYGFGMLYLVLLFTLVNTYRQANTFKAIHKPLL